MHAKIAMIVFLHICKVLLMLPPNEGILLVKIFLIAEHGFALPMKGSSMMPFVRGLVGSQ